MKFRLLAISVVIAIAEASLFSKAWAQDYPTKSIRLIVPFPPAGIVDLVARALADSLASVWDPRVLVDNRTGAGGVIGAEAAAKSSPDGYTWLMANTSFTVNPSLQRNTPYDPLKDFLPVIHIANAPNVVTVPSSLPVSTLREFVEYAKARPGVLNYGNPGNGSTNHLSAELLKLTTGIDIVGVGYKGQPPVVPDLINSRVALMYASPPLVISFIKEGRLKGLAVTSTSRIKDLPDVPTLAEAGFENTLVPPWFGIVVPTGTPPTIIRRVNDAVNKVIGTPSLIARLESIYAVPVGGTSEEFDRFLRDQIQKGAALIKGANIKVQ